MKKILFGIVVFQSAATLLFAQPPLQISAFPKQPAGPDTHVSDGGDGYLIVNGFFSNYICNAEGEKLCAEKAFPYGNRGTFFIFDDKMFTFDVNKGAVNDIDKSTLNVNACNMETSVPAYTRNKKTYLTRYYMSPSRKMALIYEQDPYERLLAFHAVDTKGDVIWNMDWDFKSGDAPTHVISASIDDAGNAVFFVQIEAKEGRQHSILYKSRDDEKLKNIQYDLAINGEVTFRTSFDKSGKIHFIGTYDRSDSQQSGGTQKGFFHGKVDPSEGNATLNTNLYPINEKDHFGSEWKLNDFFVDNNGNVTVCAVGHYMKKGSGRDFDKVFLLQMNDDGQEIWSHLITTINLRKASDLYYQFIRVGKKFIFLYYDNAEYLKYTTGIDEENISSEPKQNQLQYYMVDESGKLTKEVLLTDAGFKFMPYNTIMKDQYFLLFNTEGLAKRVSW